MARDRRPTLIEVAGKSAQAPEIPFGAVQAGGERDLRLFPEVCAAYGGFERPKRGRRARHICGPGDTDDSQLLIICEQTLASMLFWRIEIKGGRERFRWETRASAAAHG